MEKLPNKRVVNQWNKSDKTLVFHKNHIKNKEDKYKLDFIDLVLVSNFKGGNATIAYEENKTERSLEQFSIIFKNINNKFQDKSIAEINNEEFENLKKIIDEIVDLSLSKDFEISGFKASYLSALLNIYFPNLIPILDRRILLNSKIILDIGKLEKKTFQVKKIEKFYPELLDKIRKDMKNKKKTLRELDQEYFIIELPEWVK